MPQRLTLRSYRKSRRSSAAGVSGGTRGRPAGARSFSSGPPIRLFTPTLSRCCRWRIAGLMDFRTCPTRSFSKTSRKISKIKNQIIATEDLRTETALRRAQPVHDADPRYRDRHPGAATIACAKLWGEFLPRLHGPAMTAPLRLACCRACDVHPVCHAVEPVSEEIARIVRLRTISTAEIGTFKPGKESKR